MGPGHSGGASGPEGTVLRRAEPADAAAICELHLASIRGAAASHYTPQQIEAWCAGRRAASYLAPIAEKHVLVAQQGDELLGFGQLDPAAGVVEAVYVSPRHLRQGLGSRLLAALEAHAASLGLRELTLDASLNAQAFYAHAGYAPIEARDHRLDSGVVIPCVAMTRALPAPPQLRIRRAGTADAAALAAFAARTFNDTYARHNNPEDMRAHLERAFGVPQQTRELESPDIVTLLAFDAGVLAGYAQLQRRAPPACVTHAQPVELHRFYVDRKVQGRGVAAPLMAAARGAAAQLGGRHLWLSVWERNPRAIAFYARMGFADAGETTFTVGSDVQRDRVMVAPVETLPALRHDR